MALLVMPAIETEPEANELDKGSRKNCRLQSRLLQSTRRRIRLSVCAGLYRMNYSQALFLPGYKNTVSESPNPLRVFLFAAAD